VQAGLDYTALEQVSINTAALADTVTVKSTNAATAVTIHTGAGDDVVKVENISSATSIFCDADNDLFRVGTDTVAYGDDVGTMNLIGASLLLDGGTGTADTAQLDDGGDIAGNTGTLSDVLVSGLSAGSVAYANLESMNVWLGKGANTFNVVSTA